MSGSQGNLIDWSPPSSPPPLYYEQASWLISHQACKAAVSYFSSQKPCVPGRSIRNQHFHMPSDQTKEKQWSFLACWACLWNGWRLPLRADGEFHFSDSPCFCWDVPCFQLDQSWYQVKGWAASSTIVTPRNNITVGWHGCGSSVRAVIS